MTIRDGTSAPPDRAQRRTASRRPLGPIRARAGRGPAAAIRSRPILSFYVLTFVTTWGAWWPMAAQNRGLISVQLPALFFVGGLGPGIAAYIVVFVLRGRATATELLGPLLRWRVPWVWYVAAVLLFPAIWLVATVLSGTLAAELAAMGTVTTVGLALVRYLLAAVPEEVGWRGFALPALQAHHSALTASVIVGVLWALWHLPLLLGGDPTMSTYPLVPYVVWMVAESVLYAWLYNNTRASLLIPVLLHGLSNVFGVFGTAPWITTGITVATAGLVVAVFGPRHLSRTGPRITLHDEPVRHASHGISDRSRK
jgi:uncharacterized protein